MREFLQLITVAGVFYLCGLVLLSNTQIRHRISTTLTKERIERRFESERMRQMFKDSGLNISSKIVNILRYCGVCAYIVLDAIIRFLTNQPMSWLPILIGMFTIFLTSSLPLTPMTLLMSKLKSRHSISRDSELIAFIKFYESNRLREHPMQLHYFCRRVAGQFSIINSELYRLSEMLVDKKIEEALNWWILQYPSNHEFISEIRTIIMTSENASREEVQAYLQSQSQYLIKLSSDQYRKKGMFAGDMAKILTGIPAILTFIMIICFVFMYLMIIRSQTYISS